MGLITKYFAEFVTDAYVEVLNPNFWMEPLWRLGLFKLERMTILVLVAMERCLEQKKWFLRAMSTIRNVSLVRNVHDHWINSLLAMHQMVKLYVAHAIKKSTVVALKVMH